MVDNNQNSRAMFPALFRAGEGTDSGIKSKGWNHAVR